ncbi:efflux RND transporter permease subunit [Spirochaetes bacterium]|uniref:Efflux RND transporter permease subunit n=1 Tax=Candidatus Scatousia excrementipullorum TaxID=2840936 RepID=A0A9D9DMX0_9BACT|nr:efflux RND transporter permease subunit [Candidatus Scatousia excrementipullorum]
MDEKSGNLFIKRPKLAIVISLVIMLAGMLMITTLPLEEYPSITPPQVVVSATYAGASSDVIESTIAAPVEAQLNGVEDMIYMSSTSRNGSYELTLFFEIGSDPDMAVVNVQNNLQLVTPRLPEEVKRYGLTVRKTTGGPGLMMIAINSPSGTYDSLYVANYASIYIKDELARIKGVGKVAVFGSADYSMRIWLDATKMANLGVSVSEVNAAIQAQNIQAPAGDLGVEPMVNKQLIKLTMRTKGRLETPEEFENIVIRSKPDGSQIKIKDIGRVELGAESYSYFSRIGGRQSAIISVSQLPEANAVDLSNKIRKKMEELSKSFPQGIEYKIQRDETEFVRESINEVIHAIGLAVILVGIVTYLFLGSGRAAIIPFCAIPVSLIGVFIFMNLLGFSINLLILFALVLAVGLVVDDAIVVLENTQRHIQEGKTPKDATEITMKEVFGAVLATSLVLMAVFVPVSFMTGITGQMFRQFALCIASSIGLSTVVALTLAPALCSMILKSGEEHSDFKFIQAFDDWFNKVRDKYLEGAKVFIDSPKLTIITFVAIMLAIVGLFRIIPTGFLPTEDKGAIFTQIQLPDGSSASRTDAVTKEIEQELLKIPGVRSTITLVGFSGENTALIVSELENWSKRKSKDLQMQTILAKVQKQFSTYPSATIASFSPPAISGLGMFGGFEFQLLDKGDRTPQEFYDEAVKLMQIANKDPHFSMVYSSYTANLPQLLLDVDVPKAMAQGVEVTEIYNALASYFGKSYVNDFNKFGRVYRVYLQADAPFREKQADLDKIFVKNNQGTMVPLSAVVKIKNIVGPYSQARFNMYPSIAINGMARSGVSSGQAMGTMAAIADKNLPKDMGYAWSGSSLQEHESSGQIGPILAMSLVFIYLFLVGLYESWMLPVAVMLISPVALIGALFFQYVAGYSLDIYAQIGLVMLIGLSTKQAILIIEFAKDAHEAGMSIKDAAMQAAKLRFRAVMMTNIAFILGLLPLVFAAGAGAASRHSVGMTVFGGMMAVAFIGTFLVPAFYVMIEQFKINVAKFIKEKRNKNNV